MIDFEALAAYGTAPRDGCRMFGVGYDDAFERITKTFVERRFGNGGSSVKYVVGPFGSGKTHFIRQLCELARDRGCVTGEVKLTRDVDMTKTLIVYRQIAQEVSPPDHKERGIGSLLRACLAKVRSSAANEVAGRELAVGWIHGLVHQDLASEAFARVASIGLDALLAEDEERFELARRWLGGELGNRDVAKPLGVDRINQAEEGVFAARMLLSLFQLIRISGFRGTVLALDEAEQGMAVNQQSLNYIFSVMQSSINYLTDLDGGAAMVVYAITPSVRERMDAFPALQQRLESNPSFFEGNDYAAIIDLTRRDDPEEELREIGEKLTTLFVAQQGVPTGESEDGLREDVRDIAVRVALEDPSAQNRRVFVKSACARLLRSTGFVMPVASEPEV
jgi:hypothetical protein